VLLAWRCFSFLFNTSRYFGGTPISGRYGFLSDIIVGLIGTGTEARVLGDFMLLFNIMLLLLNKLLLQDFCLTIDKKWLLLSNLLFFIGIQGRDVSSIDYLTIVEVKATWD
jgi:hypothetical protein